MRNILFFFLILFSVSTLAEELALQGRVVDAETGQALPYVHISASEGKATLTNVEGEFQLQADEKDVLTFSFVGYNKLSIKAGNVSKVVRLKPYTTLMKEVTVLPLEKDDILKRVIDNLKQDYREAKHWTRKYFFRALIEENTVSFIAEAFMNANSVMNVRSAEIISGLQGYDKESGKKPMFIHGSNIHQLVEVAPRTNNSTLWKPLVKPLSHYETLKDFYKTKMQTLYDEEGQVLLRFDFTWNENLLPRDYVRRHITGTAYVDAETYRLLRFDGSCNNCTVRMGIMSYPISIDFHLEYDYSQGVASVSNLAIQGSNDFMYYRVLLFAIEEDRQEAAKTKASGENLVTALEEAGYDGSLWSKYDIIKRTKEEERIAFGE